MAEDSEGRLNHGIDAGKVTKPLQLLAAWLIGLVITNGSFLAGASQIQKPEWAAGVLVVATVLNVPIFLFCLFLLQTRFRPEMQEDHFYAKYLETRLSAASGQEEIVLTYHKTAEVKKEALALGPAQSFSTSIQINDLIPNYGNIIQELHTAGITISKTFGSTSSEPGETLPFVITVGGFPNADLFRRVVEICAKYGLFTVSRSINHAFGDRIYIGSYANRNAIADPNLINRIRNEKLSIDEIIQLLPVYETSIKNNKTFLEFDE